MANLRKTTDALRAGLGKEHPALAFSWTGESAVNVDMRRLSADETRTAELWVLPVTLVLLLVAFRSVIAAILPVACGAVTILVSLGTIGAVNRFFPASIIVVSIVSMIGLGLSIDYALLIVSRYRDGLHQGFSRTQAVARAARVRRPHGLRLRRRGRIGFGSMLLVPVSEVRSIGLGGLLVTTVAVLIANTLLPVLLTWLGAMGGCGTIWVRAKARQRAPLATVGHMDRAPSGCGAAGRRRTSSVPRRAGDGSANRFATRPLAAGKRRIGAGAA